MILFIITLAAFSIGTPPAFADIGGIAIVETVGSMDEVDKILKMDVRKLA